MTAQEQQLLQGLTDRINQTVLPEKDSDAEQFLQQSLGRNPDATYILAQTVLVQQYALDQARQQLDQARQQLDQAKQQLDQARQQQPQSPSQTAAPQKHTSFLGNLLGFSDEPTRPAPPPAQAQYAPVPNSGPPAPQYGNQYGNQYGQPMPPQANQYGSPFGGQMGGQMGGPMGGQSGGFLRSAMQTATGVAAGALAFEGIESLMHGFGQHAGYGGGSGLGGFGGDQPREEVVNNYYGDSGSHERSGDDFQSRLSNDIEDRRDDPSSSRDFADTSNDDNSTNDLSSDDDAGSDDASSFDDSSSFDDGGGSDSSSDDNS